MKLSALLKPLIDAKAPHDLIMAQILAFEEQQVDALERRREADRIRQASHRSRDVTLRHSDSLLTGDRDGRGLDNSLTQKIEPQESKKEQSAQARLMDVLDPVHAKAVVDHRRAIRKPLSPYAAGLLAKKLAACADPNSAVDTMIERGWQTVYPENAPQARGSPAKPNPALAAADALMEKFDAVSPSPTDPNPPYPRLVAFSGGG